MKVAKAVPARTTLLSEIAGIETAWPRAARERPA